MKLLQRLRNNYLIDTFINLKGNPKYCISTEPLWYIPYNLFIPFATLYMYKLGVNDSQIGLILSIGMVVQVIAALVGGVLTDKLGRRFTTVLFDTISWSLPCLVWAFAQNFWWFLVAALLNATFQITNNSWACLLVEDCDKRVIVTVYSCIQMCGLFAVFLAPISTLLVGIFDVVPVMRGLYIFSAISMTAKFLILYFWGNETEQGRIRMRETKHVPFYKLLGGYKDVLIKLLRSPRMLLVLAVMLAYSVTNTVTQNFFGLYATQNLLIDDKYLAVFPMIQAFIMLIFILALQSKLNRLPFKPVMTVGYLLFILSHVILIFAPVQSIGALLLYTLVEACSLACIVPRKEGLSAIFVDEQERARVSALLYMLSIGITAPFGWVIGLLSSVNRVLPFVFNIVIFTAALFMIRLSKEVRLLDKENIHH